MIQGWLGDPGAGKSFLYAHTAVKIMYRNRSYFERTGKIRKFMSNVTFNEKELEQEGLLPFLGYWSCIQEVQEMRGVDIGWDECHVDMDSRNWENLTPEIRRFLEQHRKRQCDIYFTAQDFSQVDFAFRRLIGQMKYCKNLIGNREPHETAPPIKYIWGLTAMWDVDPKVLEAGRPVSKSAIPELYWRTPEVAALYDTRQEIFKSPLSPFKHIHRTCDHPGCHFERVVHT